MKNLLDLIVIQHFDNWESKLFDFQNRFEKGSVDHDFMMETVGSVWTDLYEILDKINEK